MSVCFGRQNANEIMTADGRKLPPVCVCFRGEVERREDADDKRFSSSYRTSSSSSAPQTVGSRQRRSIQKRVVGCLCSMQLSPHLPPPAPLCHPTQPQTSSTYLPSIENGLLSMWRNVYRNLQAQGHQKEIPGGTEIKE